MGATKAIGAFIVVSMLFCLTPFTLIARAVGSGITELSANYLIIPGGESVTRIMVENKDSKVHRFNLQAAGVPDGFKAYFILEDKVIEKLDLPAAGKRMVELHLNTPLKILQDNGLIRIKSIREDGIESMILVSFTVSHDFSLEIINGIKKLEAMNGKSLGFDIAVTNTGNKELKDLSLKVDLPYKWTLEKIIPEKFTLKAGENAVFRLNVSIPSSQASGNSTVKIKSFNGDIASQWISIPVKVTASAGYALWAIGLVVVAGIVTVLYFRKYGRR